MEQAQVLVTERYLYLKACQDWAVDFWRNDWILYEFKLENWWNANNNNKIYVWF